MAKLPTKEELGKPSSPGRTGVVSIGVPSMQGAFGTGAGLQGLAAGIGDLGKQVLAFAEQKRTEKNATDVLAADADFNRRGLEAERAITNDYVNSATAGERYHKGRKTDLETSGSLISDPATRAAWAAKKQTDLDTGVFNVYRWQDKIEKQKQHGVIYRSLETYAKGRSEAKTPEERARFDKLIADGIDTLLFSGAITPDVEIKLRREFGTELDEAEARAAIKNDPQKYLDDRAGRTWLNITAQAEGTDERTARRNGFDTGYDVPLLYGKLGMPPRPLTQMTIREVYEFGRDVLKHPANKWNSSAMGRYQIVGTTMMDHLAAAGLTENDLFSPENQDKLAEAIRANPNQGLNADVWAGYGKYPELLSEARMSIGRHQGLAAHTGIALDGDATEAVTKVGSSFAAERRFNPPVGTPAPFNRGDKNDVTHANAWAEANGHVDAVMAGDPAAVTNMSEFIKEHDYVPENIIKSLEGMLNSQDQKKMGQALQAMLELEEISPIAFRDGASDQTEKLLETYRDVVAFGEDPVAVGQHVIDREKDAGRREADKALRAEGEKWAKTTVASYVRGLFVEGTGNARRAPGLNLLAARLDPSQVLPGEPSKGDLAALEQEAVRIYGEAYAFTGGDKGKSYELMRRAILKKWGISYASGSPRIARYPPELWNPKGIDPSWITWQTRAKVGPVVGDRPFIIEADDRTDFEVGRKYNPTYLVMVQSVAPGLGKHGGVERKPDVMLPTKSFEQMKAEEEDAQFFVIEKPKPTAKQVAK